MKIDIPNCLNLVVAPRRWFALRLTTNYNVRLRAGSTDIAYNSLREMGYDVYCPRRRLDKFNRRQRVLAEWSEPLMPGYLFIAHPRPGGVVDDWSEVRSVDEVLGPLGDPGRPLLLPEGVVEAIINSEFASAYDETTAGQQFRAGSARDLLKRRFQPGRQFVVNEGPFASFLAQVDSLTNDNKVKALVNILGGMVPVVLAPASLDDVSKTNAA